MSKKDTSYADAMNEWAAKRSFLRNRRNRFLHPNPESPAFVQVLGYLFRVAVVVFILWIVGSKVAGKYYNSLGFNEKLKSEITLMLDAKQLDTLGFYWNRKKAVCKKIDATPNESAFYRDLKATNLSFDLPLFKRLRSAWTIEQLRVENLTIELKSGGNSEASVGSASPQRPQLISAGILPTPDLSKLIISRLSCGKANFNWGLTSSTLGTLEGAKFELTNLSGDWRLDLNSGILRQNWLRDLHVDSLTARREGSQVTFSNSDVWIGNTQSRGTLEGHVTLERIPKIDLELRLPKVATRALLPKSPDSEYFVGELDLTLDIRGSVNTMSGVTTSGTAQLLSGAFSKFPAFEAIDQLLKVSTFRVFSPVAGQVEFNTGSGRLVVTDLECTSARAESVVRGSFTYTRGISHKEAAAANAIGLVRDWQTPKPNHISGNLKLGIRPGRIEGNALAQRFFTESSEGYVWIEIPLEGPFNQASKNLYSEIITAIRESEN